MPITQEADCITLTIKSLDELKVQNVTNQIINIINQHDITCEEFDKIINSLLQAKEKASLVLKIDYNTETQMEHAAKVSPSIDTVCQISPDVETIINYKQPNSTSDRVVLL